MEVKGEYGRASSTVGGGLLNGSPQPPLALCQSPFIALVGIRTCECRQAQWRCGGEAGLDGLGHMAVSSCMRAYYAPITGVLLPGGLLVASLW
jgi:hypothetical protein